MAFGKLTIRSESGETQLYELTKPVTSVGRQPGNDIVLNTSAVSRYHAQFKAEEGQVFLVDLGTVNGTFVNDEQIEPNSRVALENGDVIAMGDKILAFTFPEAPQRYDISLEPEASIVEDPTLPFRLILDEPRQLVAPGARMQLILLVENTSQSEIPISITLDGMHKDWVKLNWREVVVMPGDQVEVVIAVMPPRSSQTRPGRYPLTVRVALQDEPNQAIEAVREIDVVDFYGLAMVVNPGDKQGVYEITIQNQGNVSMGVDLHGYDRGDQLTYRFKPDKLMLGPGQTLQSTLRAVPRRGSTRNGPVDFVIIARQQGGAGFQAPVSARYDMSSVGPLAFIAGGVGLLAVIGSIALIIALAAAAWFLDLGGVQTAVLAALNRDEVAEVTTPEPTIVPPTLVPVDTTVPTEIVEPTENPVEETPTIESDISPEETTGEGPAVINNFNVSPTSVYYQSSGDIGFTWNVEGDRVEIIDVGIGSILPPDIDPAVGGYNYPVGALQPGEHIFTLQAYQGDELVVSPEMRVWVYVVCEIDPDVEGLVIDPYAEELAFSDSQVPEEVIVIGRVTDEAWEAGRQYISVALNLDALDSLGWVTFNDLDCQGLEVGELLESLPEQ